jgi:hypothetical protein
MDRRRLKLNIACQFLHCAQTEDIWLKSASEGKSGVSLITERSSQNRLRSPQSVKISLHWVVMISEESMEDLKAAKITTVKGVIWEQFVL